MSATLDLNEQALALLPFGPGAGLRAQQRMRIGFGALGVAQKRGEVVSENKRGIVFRIQLFIGADVAGHR